MRTTTARWAAAALLTVLAAGCSASGSVTGAGVGTTTSGSPGSGGTGSTTAASASAGSSLAGIDLSALPLGDGHAEATAARVGYLYVCTTAPFSRGGGAQTDGPWIHASSGTFDLAAKPHVEGSVSWPAHAFSVTISGNTRVVHTNDLPSVATGVFPIQSGTTAYQYDRNPNYIRAQDLTLDLPLAPAPAAPTCEAPGGAIGVMLDGVELFNAVDAGGRDAPAHEAQDSCWGHPNEASAYHYHALSPCMDLGSPGGTSPLLGYALDGFGIYGPYQDGKVLTNKDLDVCHGTTSAVQWDGKTVTMYHYVANFEYPYTIGCYRGTPISLDQGAAHGGPGGSSPGGGPPGGTPGGNPPGGGAPGGGPGGGGAPGGSGGPGA